MSFGLFYLNPVSTLISQAVLHGAGEGEQGWWASVPANRGCGAGSPPTVLLERGSRFYTLQLRKERLALLSRLPFGSVGPSHLQRIAARWPRYSISSAAALARWWGCHFPGLCSALHPASLTKKKKKKRHKLMLIRIAFSSDDFSGKQCFLGYSLALIFPYCSPSLPFHYIAVSQKSCHLSNIRCPQERWNMPPPSPPFLASPLCAPQCVDRDCGGQIAG